MLPERAPSEGPRSTGAVGQSQAASLQEWWGGICRAYSQHVLVEREIGDEPFQSVVFFFDLPQAAEFAHAEVRESYC